MAYNPNLYNPYIQQQQPTNGIITVNNRSSVENYPLPPSSVSPPMFLVDDDIFYVKSTDGGGTGSSAQVARQGYMGYSNVLDPVREALQKADPDSREKLRKELRSM